MLYGLSLLVIGFIACIGLKDDDREDIIYDMDDSIYYGDED